MPTTFVNTIDETEILAKRSQCDYAGNDIQTTYATKSELPTATSDLTNDSGYITLSDVPAQVNADWNATSGVSEILNKPTIPSYTAGNGIGITSNVISAKVDGTTVSTNASGELTVVGGGGGGSQVNSDWDATSGVAEILNKPTPKTLTAGANISISEGVGTITISAAAGLPASTSADEGKCLVVDSNGDPEWGTGGKTYTGTDGVVVDNVNDTVGLEAPVDLVAGPGIVVDNPDGNTLRVSMAADYEVELLSSPVTTPANTEASTTLAETVSNFEYVTIYGYTDDGASYPFSIRIEVPQGVSGDITWSCAATNNGYVKFILGKVNGTSLTLRKVKALQWGGGWADPGGTWGVTKVVGIHRIANN